MQEQEYIIKIYLDEPCYTHKRNKRIMVVDEVQFSKKKDLKTMYVCFFTMSITKDKNLKIERKICTYKVMSVPVSLPLLIYQSPTRQMKETHPPTRNRKQLSFVV